MASRPEPLCFYCLQIPIKEIYTHSPQIVDSASFPLDTFSRIIDSRCPFCRLVNHALCEASRGRPRETQDLKPDTKLFIGWSYASDDSYRVLTLRWQMFSHTNDGFRVRLSDLCFAVPENDRHVDMLRPSMSSGIPHQYLKYRLESQIDFSRVRGWLAQCDKGHASRCLQNRPGRLVDFFPGVEVLRSVDVERGCLVEMTEVVPYIALSYVWGTVWSTRGVRTTKRNKASLMRPRSLFNMESSLPLTISDAIALSRSLGIRYLWVDALCLVQNDAEDVRKGVEVMDSIYEMSWLTVVAACGHDANAGLPGVRPGFRAEKELVTKICQGIKMGLCAQG